MYFFFFFNNNFFTFMFSSIDFSKDDICIKTKFINMFSKN